MKYPESSDHDSELCSDTRGLTACVACDTIRNDILDMHGDFGRCTEEAVGVKRCSFLLCSAGGEAFLEMFGSWGYDTLWSG